jgi:autotransporter-associated beta strand protein
MTWEANWTFIGSNGANSNLFLGNGGVILTSTPQVTVQNAASTLAVGGVISGTDYGLTKAGPGTLELRGASTYTGETTVNAGTLQLGANHVIPDASNVTIGTATLDANTRTDTTGTLDVTGTAVINLGTGAALAFADSKSVDWTGGTLNITGTLGATSLRFGDSADDLTSGPGGQLAKISVNGSGLGTYILDANGYLVPGGGLTAYDTWTTINAPGSDPNEDFDNDGVPNAIEFVVGGDKNSKDIGKLPAVATSGGNMTFTFTRDRDSVDASVSVKIEVGTNLSAWPDTFNVGANTAGSTTGVSVTDHGNGTDTIILTLPQAPHAGGFARLKVAVTQ